ncbi:MAG: insulinase family protein, partial [Proteobacteria bacterium]|nr:insulinase family protein [Pseudomonadota bacterium]
YGQADYEFIHSPRPNSTIYFHLDCAPENVDRVISGLKEILKRLREKTVSPEFVETIRRTQRQFRKKQVASNEFRASELKTMLTWPATNSGPPN